MLSALRRRWTPDDANTIVGDPQKNVSAGRLQLNRGLLRMAVLHYLRKASCAT